MSQSLDHIPDSPHAIDSFAAQYWFFCQIYALGRTGQADPEKSVLSSLLEVEKTHKAWLKARRG